jgi:hypothetical protein
MESTGLDRSVASCLVCNTYRSRRMRTFRLLLLLRDLKNDFEFYRHPEGKAGNANHLPHR